MTGRITDRKTKRKTSPTNDDASDILTTFKLPESLPTSEVEFPVLIKHRSKANWKKIVEDSEKWHEQIRNYEVNKTNVQSTFINTEYEFIQNKILVHLIPALIETLNKATTWKALTEQKCFFNGIDHLVQFLWNNNPRHPERKDNNLHLFNMPWVRKQLMEKPREIYPKSWLWPQDYAATVIQKTFRRYLVQKEESVQELRDFWRRLELETHNPDMETNPFLANKFASSVLKPSRH